MISSATASKSSSGRWWQTLKFRLAAWNATVVVVTALVTLLGLRQGVRWALVHELDQVLINDVAEIALSVASSSEQGAEEVREELLRKSQGHLRHGWYVELLNDQGERLWASPDAQSDVGQSPFRGQANPATIAGYRIVQERLQQPVDGIHFIRVGAKLDFLDQDMARIDRLVALAAGAVLVVAPLCGYWLAARAARVIGDIITTASRLRPSYLEERLPIRGSADELDQLAHTINSLLDRIAAYLNTKRDFLANASHELRTPLAAIRSSVEVALNGNRSSEEYEELLVDVIDECSALETLVNQLLLLSETEAELPAAKFEPLDLGSQVMKAVDMFSGVAEARGIRLRSAKADYAPVLGNGPHLRQLLNNLIDNAVKYTASGGEIVVALARNESTREVHLRVQDSGSGIPADEQRHIFERFYRGESARSRGHGPSGTGLGLSICQSIVHNHGGVIHCESQPGRGTCITVTFPLASAAVETAGT
jgi:signal transduction histidine kinase